MKRGAEPADGRDKVVARPPPRLLSVAQDRPGQGDRRQQREIEAARGGERARASPLSDEKQHEW
ncbi:hypothetical protein Misp02_61620 [Microtetraspora sp. NBRC 16547]|nr:hypothetical protein Misp02_61620 [Microtetraspora sp. NBRC 16547]